MSKRCKLQKEYFKQFGFYKGDGKYTDHYVNWLENQLLELRLSTDGSNEVKCCSCDYPLVRNDGNIDYCGNCGDDLEVN